MPVKFRKELIAARAFESAGVFDVDGDGVLDIVSMAYWYQGPDYRKWHPIGEVARRGEYYDDFSTIAMDINGNGRLDFVTGKFSEHTVSPGHGHGLGFGDIDGDGRGDFVVNNGWYQAPQDPLGGKWEFHQEFDLGWDASIPILVEDVNGDGLNDLIVGGSHSYGLSWWEQRRDGDGKREWVKHPIDPFNSQYHDLHWMDIDGDGEKELVTGKRYRAHNGMDPGAFDDLGIHYFKWTGEGFAKQVICHGPLGVGAGCGIQFAVADLRGNGRLDIVAPGKDGLHVFWNEGT